MTQNQFLPIATGDGANTLTAAQFAALGIIAQGFQAGVVPSISFNTILRQLSTVTSAVAQFTADNQTADVLDDGVVSNFESKFTAALKGAMASSSVHYGIATGTNDAMVVTAIPALKPTVTGTYQPGSFLIFKSAAGSASTSTSPTINGNSIGNTAVTKRNGAALAAGDIQPNTWYSALFDGNGCDLIALTTSDIAAIVAAALAPLQAEIQNVATAAGFADLSDPQALTRAIRGGKLEYYIDGAPFTGTAAPTPVAGAPAILPNPAHTSLFEGLHVRVRMGSACTGPTPLSVSGMSAPIKRLGGLALVGGEWAVGDVIDFVMTSGAWQVCGLTKSDVVSLISAYAPVTATANVTLYVRPDGADTNNGSANTAAAAFKTISAAVAYGLARYNFAGFALNVVLGIAGTYSPPGALSGIPNITVTGDTSGSNAAAYVISGTGPTNGALIGAFGATNLTVKGVTLVNTGSTAHHVAASQGGSVLVQNVIYTGTVSTLYSLNTVTGSGQIAILGNCVVSNCVAANIFNAAQSGTISLVSSLAVTNNPSFSTVAAATVNGNIVVFSGASITGTAQGQRYNAATGGRIITNGGGPNFFPGTIAGTSDSVSTYA